VPFNGFMTELLRLDGACARWSRALRRLWRAPTPCVPTRRLWSAQPRVSNQLWQL